MSFPEIFPKTMRGPERTAVRIVAGALILLSALGVKPLQLCAQSHPSPDIEGWNELDLSAALRHRVTVTVPVVLRNSASLSDPELFGVGPIFDFSVLRHVTVTGGYLFVKLPNIGSGYTVHVPLAAVTFNQKFGRLQASDRNRAEGLIGIPKNPIRYRNKLTLDLPLRSGRWEPFVTDEAVYDFSKSFWSQNRFQAGIGREIGPRLRLDVYYMERNLHLSNPTANHVLATTLQIKFDRLTRKEGSAHEVY